MASLFHGIREAFPDVPAGSIYPGYPVSPLGSVLGFVYGFVDLTIMGTLVGWLYNKTAAHADMPDK